MLPASARFNLTMQTVNLGASPRINLRHDSPSLRLRDRAHGNRFQRSRLPQHVAKKMLASYQFTGHILKANPLLVKYIISSSVGDVKTTPLRKIYKPRKLSRLVR